MSNYQGPKSEISQLFLFGFFSSIELCKGKSFPTNTHNYLDTMNQGKYSVTWHTYSDHLKTMMKELMMNEDFSDVTLVTEDKKQIHANINILSACSPLFKDILKKEKNCSSIVYLRDIQFSEMESIMQYIYLGEATISEDRMREFLAVGRLLEIKEMCNAKPEPNTNNEPYDVIPSDVLIQMLDEEIVISGQLTESNVGHLPPSDQDEDKMKPDASTQIFDEELVISGQLTESNKKPSSPSDQDESPVIVVEREQTSNQGDKMEQGELSNNPSPCVPDSPMNDGEEKTSEESVVNIQSKLKRLRYVCDHCKYKFATQTSLNKHITIKHDGVGVKYTCDQCDYQATTKENLTGHIDSIHGEIMYPCDKCDYRASGKRRKENLMRHIQSEHKGVKFKCNMCDFQGTQQSSLTRHIQSIHEGIKYACDQCVLHFTQESSLYRHMKVVHKIKVPPKKTKNTASPNSKYECDKCYMTFSLASLYRHKRTVHQGAKFSCDQCDKKFPANSYLRKHKEAVHEGVRYACDQCDFQATTQKCLNLHIQSKHEGIKYESIKKACDQCDYKTRDKSDLTAHIRSKHEGVKYACDQCDRLYTHQRSLRGHIQRHHESL